MGMTPAYEAINSTPSPDIAEPAPLPSTSGEATQSAVCTAHIPTAPHNMTKDHVSSQGLPRCDLRAKGPDLPKCPSSVLAAQRRGTDHSAASALQCGSPRCDAALQFRLHLFRLHLCGKPRKKASRDCQLQRLLTTFDNAALYKAARLWHRPQASMLAHQNDGSADRGQSVFTHASRRHQSRALKMRSSRQLFGRQRQQMPEVRGW